MKLFSLLSSHDFPATFLELLDAQSLALHSSPEMLPSWDPQIKVKIHWAWEYRTEGMQGDHA